MDQEENPAASIMDFGDIQNNIMHPDDDDDEDSVKFAPDEMDRLAVNVSTEEEDDEEDEDSGGHLNQTELDIEHQQDNVPNNIEYPQPDHYVDQFNYEPPNQPSNHFIPNNQMTPAVMNYRTGNYQMAYSTPINPQNPPMPAFTTPAIPSIDEEPYQMRNYNSNQSPYHSPDYVHGGGENADQLVGEPVNNNNSRNNDTVMPVDNMAILANLQAQHQKPHGEIHSMNRFAYQYKDLNEHQATQQSSEIDENHLMPGGEEMDIHRQYTKLNIMYELRGKEVVKWQKMYNELQSEFRALKHEVTRATQERDSTVVSKTELQKLCDELSAKAIKDSEEMASKQAQYQKTRETLILKDKKIKELESDLDSKLAMIEQLQSNEMLEDIKMKSEFELQSLREQFEKSKNDLEQEMFSLRAQLDDKQVHINNLLNEVQMAQDNQERTRIENVNLRNLIGASDSDKDLMISRLNNEIAQLKDQIQQLHHNRPSTNLEVALQQEIEQYKHELEESRNRVDKLEADLAIESHSVSELERENNELKSQLSQMDPRSIQMAYEQRHQLMIQEVRKNHEEDLKRVEEFAHGLEIDLSKAREAARKSEAELSQTQKMYRDLCEEKANLHDTIRSEMETEYKKRLDMQVELVIGDRIDREKAIHAAEIKSKLDEASIQFKLLQNEIESLKQANGQLEQQLHEKSIAVLDTNSEIQRTNELLTHQIQTLQEQLTSCQAALSQKDTMFEEAKNKLVNEMNELKEKISSNEASLKQNQLVMDEAKANFEAEKARMIDKLACEQVSQAKMKSEFDTEKARLIDEIKQLSDKLASFDQICHERDMALNDKTKYEQEMNRIAREKDECELKCQQDLINAKNDVKHLHMQMEKKEEEVNRGLDALANQHQREIDEANKILENAEFRIQKLEHDLQQATQTNNSLVADLEAKKRAFQAEMVKKEEDANRMAINLRDEYEKYTKEFRQKHMEQLDHMTREKTAEFEQEKQKLLERHAANLDQADQIWRNKEKEWKSKLSALSIKPKTDSREVQTEPSESLETSMLNKTDLIHTENQFTSQLMSTIQKFEQELQKAEDKIRELDECLSKADDHCINELQKQRDQLEDEYKRKLENITYGSEFVQLQDSYEVLFKENQEVKSELEAKQRELLKCQNDLFKVKKESTDIETTAAKYRKVIQEDKKLIESLKHEMVTMSNKQLTEISILKMNAERDKEDLRQDLERALDKIKQLEKELDESDETVKRKCDMLKTQLEQEHDLQMSRMNKKMNDMMKTHTEAIDKVKRQYQRQFDITRVSLETTTHSCQTDLSCEDIKRLEAMPDNFAKTARGMKNDFLKEYDALNLTCDKKIDKQLKLERDYVRSHLKSYFIPAAITSSLAWSQLDWSEELSTIKQKELEQQLDKILRSLPPRDRGSKSDENSSPRSTLTRASTSSLATTLSFTQSTRANLVNNIINSKPSAFTTPASSIIRDEPDPISQILANSRDHTPTANLTSSRTNFDKLYSSASQIVKSPSHVNAYQYTSIKNFGSQSQLSPSNSPLTHSASSSSTNFNFTERSSTLRNETESNRRQTPSLQNFKTITVNRPVAERVDKEFVQNWKIEYKKAQQEDPVDFYIDPPANGDTDDLSPGLFQKNEFHKKYRTQQIRQKKSTRDTVTSETYRPQSVTNLSRAASDFLPVTSNTTAHKSIQDLTKDTKTKSFNSKQMRIDLESDNDTVPSREESDPEANTKSSTSGYLAHTALRSQSSVGITCLSNKADLVRSDKKFTMSGSSSSSSSSSNLKKISSGVSSTSSHCVSSTNSLPRSNSRSRTPTSSSSSSSSATAEVINENFSYRPHLDTGVKKVDHMIQDYKKSTLASKKPPFK